MDVASTADDNMLLRVISEALDKLAVEALEKAKLIKLRYFAGLSIEDAANAAGTVVTVTTINVNAVQNPRGVHGHFSMHSVRSSVATGEILREDLYEADIYDILMSDNAAYIAGIFTRYVNGGQEVDLTASPGRLMIKLTDNGEGSNAAPDTYSLIAVAAEEWDNDPEDPFDFANEDLLGLLDLRAFNNTAGNIAVQNK